MATLVLGTVGTLVGGPLGGALGALIGRGIDQAVLFRPQGREGPRLTDLAVQSSQYGSAFPRIYGRTRVAGTVIWATDLQERRVREGGGKGRPATTRYSYSVSFAVALASRPIIGIGRIWAEGNLLRGADGVFTGETGFRLYHGHGDQGTDPLIAAAEGAGSCPAYRGLAYAVFEDMALEDFGNRIPSLTFEVIADTGEISFADLAESAAGVVCDEDVMPPIIGISLTGEARRDALRTLAAGFPFALAEEGGIVQVHQREAMAVSPPVIAASALLARSGDGGPQAAMGVQRIAPRNDALSLRYYEPERDYQPGLRRTGASTTGRMRQIDMPAVMTASTAQARTEAIARLERDGLDQIEVRTALVDLAVRPGRLVTVHGADGLWRVTRWHWGAEGVDLTLVSYRQAGAAGTASTDPGRSVNTPDNGIGPSRLALFDLPSPMDRPMASSHIALAVAGASPGWRGAQVYRLEADGALGDPLDFLRAAATMGEVVVPPGPGTPLLRDNRNSLTVRLVRDGPFALINADAEGLSRGANMAMVGREAIQFAHAQPLGDSLFRLTGLWRGRGGTEDQIHGHVAGEPFVLVNEALGLVDPAMIGAAPTFAAAAQGRDDAEPVEAQLASHGRAVMPLSAVHGRPMDDGAGGIRLEWVRRSRLGYAWRDGVDVPLGEDHEAYRVVILADGVPIAELAVPMPVLVIDPADLAVWRAVATGSLMARITQLGALAVSPPLLVAVPL